MKNSYRHVIVPALALACLAGTLSACAPLIIGGAAVGTMVALDRRTSGAQLEDEQIELRAGSRLRDAIGARGRVTVTSYNRQVLVTGQVQAENDKKLAEQTVSRVENVRSVINELTVMPESTLTQRSSDTLVTGKVKASLVDASDLYSSAYRVLTERGTVYLIGRVTQREADRATQITRSIEGVSRVVRIFEIIPEEELQRLAIPQPAKGKAPVQAAVPAATTPAAAAPAATTPATAAPAATTAAAPAAATAAATTSAVPAAVPLPTLPPATQTR